MPFLPSYQMVVPAEVLALAIRNWMLTVFSIPIADGVKPLADKIQGSAVLTIGLETALDKGSGANSLLTGRGFLTSVELDPLNRVQPRPAPKQLLQTHFLFLMPQTSTHAFDDLLKAMETFFGKQPFIATIRDWKNPDFIELRNLDIYLPIELEVPIFYFDSLELLFSAAVLTNQSD